MSGSRRRRNSSSSNGNEEQPTAMMRNRRLEESPEIINLSDSPATVTPSSHAGNHHCSVRRSLSSSLSPHKVSSEPSFSQEESPSPSSQLDTPTKRKLLFGKECQGIEVRNEVRDIYKLIRKQTGSIGGNGSFGAIYGELTMGSMQKMVNLMKVHAEFGPDSRFIDVGSGLGKPSLHVSQDPGVEFAYGIEMERVRWMLSMTNLKSILTTTENHVKCLFAHGNIMDANTFHPFTHVYMFSIGFPPYLWEYLAKMFNRSASPYLICFHPPKDIIDAYGFHVKLVTQTQTSMHGSKEGHMGYIYKRSDGAEMGDNDDDACDALFRKDYTKVVQGTHNELLQHVETHVKQQYKCGRRTRSSKTVMSVLAKWETPPPKQSRKRIKVYS